MKTIHHFFQ